VANLLVRVWEEEERRLGIEGAEKDYVISTGAEFPLLAGGSPGTTGTVDEVSQTIRSKMYVF
jgi:hypothetical protein